MYICELNLLSVVFLCMCIVLSLPEFLFLCIAWKKGFLFSVMVFCVLCIAVNVDSVFVLSSLEFLLSGFG